MPQPVDIDALATAALALVEQEREKTASISSPVDAALKTDVGKALKEAADLVRGHRSEITNADLQISKSAEASTNPTKKVKKIYENRKSPASKLGSHFRKMASDVRETGSDLDESKAVKVAQLITAAIGLQHLKRVS